MNFPGRVDEIRFGYLIIIVRLPTAERGLLHASASSGCITAETVVKVNAIMGFVITGPWNG